MTLSSHDLEIFDTMENGDRYHLRDKATGTVWSTRKTIEECREDREFFIKEMLHSVEDDVGNGICPPSIFRSVEKRERESYEIYDDLKEEVIE